jgi:hypothetical protein
VSSFAATAAEIREIACENSVLNTMKRNLGRQLAETFLLEYGHDELFELHVFSDRLAGRVALEMERHGCAVEWRPGATTLIVRRVPRSDDSGFRLR